ncbi:TPA: hypothetical protein ACTZ5W_006032 [Bacillus cereus]
MNELQWLTRIQQNVRILREYKLILQDEIFHLNSLTWYEKECLLEQINCIHPLLTKIASDIDTLKNLEYKKEQLDKPITHTKTENVKNSNKGHKKIYPSYFDYMHTIHKKTKIQKKL